MFVLEEEPVFFLGAFDLRSDRRCRQREVCSRFILSRMCPLSRTPPPPVSA